MSLPKSTVVGCESTCTLVELFLRAMLLMVMLKDTTDGSGASSPVTNTCAWALPEPPDEDELPPPQAVKASAVSASKTVRNPKRFIGRSLSFSAGDVQV